jgi:hypothetical protein
MLVSAELIWFPLFVRELFYFNMTQIGPGKGPERILERVVGKPYLAPGLWKSRPVTRAESVHSISQNWAFGQEHRAYDDEGTLPLTTVSWTACDMSVPDAQAF